MDKGRAEGEHSRDGCIKIDLCLKLYTLHNFPAVTADVGRSHAPYSCYGHVILVMSIAE